ncbi:MAG TPA: DUF1285 domain-containing protein [Rhabdaerophilum sp.]|nr:DUF1285 domain-containing protein [Rhabdaerophilum sp.]
MTETALPKRFLDVAAAHAGRRLPPVEKWHPDYCGEIPMRIARDGRWFYMGTPIERMPLVRLFATILRNDGDRHVLVTPVERVGIEVEDAPFLAVEMEAMAGANGETLAFRTNLDDLVVADADHPLRFELDEAGGLKPYVRVRGDLWARLTRSLALDLAERLVEGPGDRLGLWLDGAFHPVPDEAMAG